MDHATLIGLTAGTLTTVSFLPQVIKTWKSKSTHDISMGMFMTLCLGLLIWVVYGFSINSVPVILTNIISFILAFTVLILKIKHR